MLVDDDEAAIRKKWGGYVSKRVKQAKAKQRAAGLHQGGSRQFGYQIGEDRKLIPDPVEQAAIEDIRAMRARGETLMAIRDEMRARGHRISHNLVSDICRRGETNTMRPPVNKVIQRTEQVLDTTNKTPTNAIPVVFEGTSYPSKSALARHLCHRLGWPEQHHGKIVSRLAPYSGDVTEGIGIVLRELPAEKTTAVTPPAPAIAREPSAAPIEIGETLGLIRGAFDTLSAQLAEAEEVAREMRDRPLSIAGIGPELTRHFERQTQVLDQLIQGFRNIERLHATTERQVARYEEMFQTILHKVHQLAHDLQIRQPGTLPPAPTRRDPMAQRQSK